MHIQDNDVNDKLTLMRRYITKYESLVRNNFNILKGNLLGDEERELVTNDMNAFLFGLISDQSVKAELAWSLPYNLKQRLGALDLSSIATMPQGVLTDIIRRKPALHRYPANIAKYLISASEMLLERYDGDAANIWTNATVSEIIHRLEEFKGISHKKAALGSLLLVRDLGLQVADKQNINLVYDVHVRRVCLRTGLSQKDTFEHINEVGKRIFPEFPGRLTSTFWAIGREFCRPLEPLCDKCPLCDVCNKSIYLGRDLEN